MTLFVNQSSKFIGHQGMKNVQERKFLVEESRCMLAGVETTVLKKEESKMFKNNILA